jgi:hypothetical protein
MVLDGKLLARGAWRVGAPAAYFDLPDLGIFCLLRMSVQQTVLRAASSNQHRVWRPIKMTSSQKTHIQFFFNRSQIGF